MTQTELLDRLDALLAEYIASGADCATPRMAALHSPRAAWCAVYTHVEHRLHGLPRPKDDR